MKKAALLVNLGSPDSTSVRDVRRYLREFLMDERVINKPFPLRWFIVHAFILPKRPVRSAEAYASIWTDEGSPLLVYGERLREAVAAKVDLPVGLAMRYGNPSITKALLDLNVKDLEELFIIPLYPHYAMSSYETAAVAAEETARMLNRDLKLAVLPPFYDDPAYVDALVAGAGPYLDGEYDKLLFSFHGIPVSHLRAAGKPNRHCGIEGCCARPSYVQDRCYRYQCLKTVEAFVKRAGVPTEKYALSFQSRLGKEPWLEPFTDKTLQAMPGQGIKAVKVICPAFVSDNLETLEEIAQEGKKLFLEAGGKSFGQIPCLNTHPAWVGFLAEKLLAWQNAQKPLN